MRFMMIMFPKDYENAKPGWVPDLKGMEVMGKYNEQLQKAGVLLAVDGLTPPSTMSVRVTLECGWNGGDRGGLAEWEQIHGKKKAKVCLDVDWRSEKRVETGDAGGRPSWRSSLLG